jgi:hypothetical protein
MDTIRLISTIKSRLSEQYVTTVGLGHGLAVLDAAAVALCSMA